MSGANSTGEKRAPFRHLTDFLPVVTRAEEMIESSEMQDNNVKPPDQSTETRDPLRRASPLRFIATADAPAGWVRQRGGSDCAIAALATAMSATYEDTAAMLGFSCDPVTRDAIGVDNGMMMLELGAPLLRKGWSGTLLFCDGLHLVGDEARERAAGRVMVKTQELAALIVGRTAVLQVWKEGPLGPNHHFVAYRDGLIIDTDEAGFATYELAKIRVMLAMVLVQSQPASQP